MPLKIGIDAGGSLIKIAYYHEGSLHVKLFSNHMKKQVINWLPSTNTSIYLTGGGSRELQNDLPTSAIVIDEFTAVCKGTNYLLQQEKETLLEKYILVSIGTGTSYFLVSRNNFTRLFGSGIGGGIFMGLGYLLSGKSDYNELVQLSQIGNHKNSDVLVNDIYTSTESPLERNLTAANFGKVQQANEATSADYLASLTQLIGESTILLASQAAMANQTDKIVFTGSTLSYNKPLKKVLSEFQAMLPYEPIFLDNGPYVGAIGAFLS
ncbi:MAG: type II pantothenate kinase [Bacillota bacterium]|uniref:type II pantothenate kinase n=1 Tax=Virgibacillus TaxID=84406 RepID=UPI000415B621|nr:MULTISPECIES: type II pantothenate kinase [Bacillaceae]MDY7044115.1 type II pantothenate kinase [Virgibacillus sp. M23]WBX82090.1 type II pantothenate kinase [Virgibacillus salarius]